MAELRARVVAARTVRGNSATGGDYTIVTVACPICGGTHEHGWAGGGTRLPECGRGPAYRLLWMLPGEPPVQ